MPNTVEFTKSRSEHYEKAIFEYPNARNHDIQAMYELLDPQPGERILGFGEGNGYFCEAIANSIGEDGTYVVTDPSQYQLNNLRKRVTSSHVEVICTSAEYLPEEEFDKVWSFGAFHHCHNQTNAMQSISNSLRDGGKLILCDVFAGSPLARHFDTVVSRYCDTGHEVKFLSDEFAETLCYLSGLQLVELVDLNQRWKFDSKQDLGKFVYHLHALTKLPRSEQQRLNTVIEGCEKILGIHDTEEGCVLYWSMKALIAEKF